MTTDEMPKRAYAPIGTRAEDEIEPSGAHVPLACLECRLPARPGQKFCLGCGAALGWMADAVEDGGAQGAYRLRPCPCCERRPKLPGRFCTSCGEVTLCGRCHQYRREPTRFCSGCGLDLGALRFAPPPSGDVGTFSFHSTKVEYDFKAPPDKLAVDLQRFGEMRKVDPGRLALAVGLVDALQGLARTGGEASIRVDFKGYRTAKPTPVPWFRGPPLSLARHGWLEANAPFFDGTRLQLILVTSVRGDRIAVPKRWGKGKRRVPVEQVTDLVLFTLKLVDGRGLEPSDEEYMRAKLADETRRLSRVSLRPDAATLEFDFGPAHVFKGSPRERVYTGYNVDRLLTPASLVKVVEASYKAILDAADRHAF